MTEDPFVDSHGVEVFTRRWTVGGPRGVVLVSHGASEHSGRYDRFARALKDARFSVAALDHRGHGRTASSTKPGVMGPGGGDAVIDDLHELRTTAGSGDQPVFLFGHSLGSLIALAYLTRHSEGLAGGILCGFPSNLDEVSSLGQVLNAFVEAGMRDEPAEGLLSEYNTAFEPARTPFDWLSRDDAEVDRYISDRMCGDGNPLTYGYLVDLFGVVAPARDRLASITCPVLVIAGEQDAAGGMGSHPKGLADALETSGVPVDLTLYEGARHELLNETNREEVTEAIIDWLTARL